jgi:hypothetical protein
MALAGVVITRILIEKGEYPSKKSSNSYERCGYRISTEPSSRGYKL